MGVVFGYLRVGTEEQIDRRPKRFGYARVSSKGQELHGNSLEDQVNKLLDAGCNPEDIEEEAFTGTTMDRPKFKRLLAKMQSGDTLIVTKLDRFTRTAAEGVAVIKELMNCGIKVHVLNMGLVEDTPTGRLILNIMSAFAEFERDNIVERLSEGRAVAKENNPEYKEGRKSKMPEEFVHILSKTEAGVISVAQGCRELGIHKTQWYRWKKDISCRA